MGKVIRVMPAVVVVAVLAGTGQAVASSRPAAGKAGAGIISTVAGGVGGPEAGTNVALTPCNVAFVGGHLYIADTAPRPRSHQTGAVREMSPGSSTLTTLAGSHLFSGPIGDGRPATKAPFTTCGVTADQAATW